MTASYKILFSIDLLNSYYKDNRCKDFSIVPSLETTILLKRYYMLYRVVENKLVVLAKASVGNAPAIELAADEKFVFYLGLNNPAFVSFTNVDVDELASKRFYFSNLNQNKQGDVFNISRRIAAYNNLTSYKPGAMVSNGTDAVFECIKNTKGHDTATAFWMSLGSQQSVSPSDMLQPSGTTYNHTASSASTQFKIVVFSLNKSTGSYTDVIKTATQKFTTSTRSVQVDLSTLPKGKYRITINADEVLLYVDNEFLSGGYFGVMEAFSHLSNTNEFSFFAKIPPYANATPYKPGDLVDDGTTHIFECIKITTGHNTTDSNFWKPRGKLQGIFKEINYTVHFANRRAFWKYLSTYQKVDNIKVKGSHDPVVTPFASFSTDPVGHAGRKDFFLSDKLLLISEKPDDNNFELMLAAPHSNLSPPAPKADAFTIGMLTQQDNDFYCNIYLNY